MQECTMYFVLKKKTSVISSSRVATDAHVFNRKFYRANASLAFTYITRALQFIRAFFPVHAYQLDPTVDPDTIRISFDGRNRRVLTRGCNISCCIRLNCKTIGDGEEIRTDIAPAAYIANRAV